MAKFEYKKPASDFHPFHRASSIGEHKLGAELDHRSEPVVLPGNELEDYARVSGR